MVKKKDSSPLLSDDEVEALVKDAEKRTVKRPIKKPVEKIEPIPMEKPKPKPIKKEVMVELVKIMKAIKKQEQPKPEIIDVPIKSPDIEYTIKTMTRFDLNWYYMKEKLMKFKRWMFSPYTLYSNWFNKKFNSPKPVMPQHDKRILPKLDEGIFPEGVEDLYEEIKKDYKPNIPEMMKKHTAKLPVVQEDISMKEIEAIFEEMKPIMIAKIYADVNKKVNERTRKIVIKGGF